MTDKVLLWY